MAVVSGSRSHYWWICIVLAIVVGGVLRFAAIGRQSFWYDEAACELLESNASYLDLFIGRVRDNGNPPFHFLTDKLVGEFLPSSDEATHRLLPALFGLLAVPLIGLLGRRLHSPQAGIVAAWLLAVSPFQIEMSNEGRVYSFLHFITTLNALLFVRWLSSLSWRDGLAYAAGTALACYSHYFIALVILGHLVVVLAQQDRWRLFVRWCQLMGVAAVLWIPWAPAFVSQLATPGNLSRMGGSWKSQFAATPVILAVGRTFAWRDAGPALIGLTAVASLAGYWIPAVFGLIRPLPDPRLTRPLLSAWVLLPVIVPLAAALSGVPVYHHRYASVGLPGFLIAVAIGLTSLPRTYRTIAALVIVTSTVFSLANYYSHPLKDDWRSAARAMLAGACPEQVVLTDTDFEVTPFLFYARRYHSVPQFTYGLMVDKDGDDLNAVRYDNGLRHDKAPRNYTEDIYSARCVIIGLCVPVRDEQAYRSSFKRHGFKVTKSETFYRITIVRFEKSAGG